MNIIVQKYGGSSVENKEKLEKICDRIIKYKNNKKDLVVIVSAQGKTTDSLLKKASEYCNISRDRKALDILLSTGEMQTASLLTMMLCERGYDATCLAGTNIGILTDSNFGNAKILDVNKELILNHLKSGKIVVACGFQGVDTLGNITTLGRGGSDLSAVAIASSLKAKKCEIYTDVDGIFSTDPRITKQAKIIKYISYDEMLEASSNGAKVLHNRCVNFAKNNNLRINVKNSFNNTLGSYVGNYSSLKEENTIKIISKQDNFSKISIVGDMISEINDLPALCYNIASELNTKIHLISYSELSFNLLIETEKANKFIELIHKKLF